MRYRIMSAIDKVRREKRVHPSLATLSEYVEIADASVPVFSPTVKVVAMGYELYRPFLIDTHGDALNEFTCTRAFPGPRNHLRIPGIDVLFAFDREIEGEEIWFFVQDDAGSGRWEVMPQRREPPEPPKEDERP